MWSGDNQKKNRRRGKSPKSTKLPRERLIRPSPRRFLKRPDEGNWNPWETKLEHPVLFFPERVFYRDLKLQFDPT